MTKDNILKLLEENKDIALSGEEIGASLNISRNSVWKAINKLKEEGFLIESIKNKGYMLKSESQALSLNEIKDNIKNEIISKNIILHKELSSTNSTLKDMAKDSLEDFTVVIADSQTQGRGRLGRNFYSPKSSGIYLSLYLKYPSLKYDVSMLTICAAVALKEAVEKDVDGKLGIKWVNDLYLNNKKIAGILTECEMELETRSFKHAIVGIGLNVLTESFPDDLKDIASSIYLEEKKKINRNILISKLLDSLYLNLELLHKDSNKIVEKYNKTLLFMDEVVKVRSFNREFLAKVLRINEKGNLIVLEDNKELTISSGEIVLRERR